MSVELRPLGVACNIQCQYCYQNPERDAGNVPQSYQIDRLLATIDEIGSEFTLFGGEPLMVPEPDLETIWSWGFQRFGSNCVQTNGSLINDNHIALFRKHKVHVGISIDGPSELNDVRWAGSLVRTRELTAKSETAIERLCAEGIPPSLIVTLHRNNATRDKLPRMKDWFERLDQLGVTSARLHVLESEDACIRDKYGLSAEENQEALLFFARLESVLPHLRFDVFDDIQKLSRGEDDSVTCVWGACDPFTTRAVQGVDGDGHRSNCGRTNKEGIDFVKAEQEGFERYLALYQTPQSCGGCKDCRFFIMCKGQCPGTAIDGDWRNRTEHCELWKGLFEHYEHQLQAEGMVPVSQRSDRKELEDLHLKAWTEGRNLSIAQAIREMAGGAERSLSNIAHGDVSHGDSDHGDRAHGDAPHGDAPHGDA